MGDFTMDSLMASKAKFIFLIPFEIHIFLEQIGNSLGYFIKIWNRYSNNVDFAKK
jgi:hypothetical protein